VAGGVAKGRVPLLLLRAALPWQLWHSPFPDEQRTWAIANGILLRKGFDGARLSTEVRRVQLATCASARRDRPQVPPFDLCPPTIGFAFGCACGRASSSAASVKRYDYTRRQANRCATARISSNVSMPKTFEALLQTLRGGISGVRCDKELPLQREHTCASTS
jgi:hypothetical protein